MTARKKKPLTGDELAAAFKQEMKRRGWSLREAIGETQCSVKVVEGGRVRYEFEHANRDGAYQAAQAWLDERLEWESDPRNQNTRSGRRWYTW